MFRQALMGLAITFVVISGSEAQQVQVQKKPAPQVGKGEYAEYDQWTVSYSRRSGPTVFELDGTYKTEQAARNRAQQLIAWSNRMDANSGWRLAVILIEGEASVQRLADEAGKSAEEGKEAYGRLKDAKKAVDKARELEAKGLTAQERKRGDTLREYRDALKSAYDRAMNAKRNLTSMTGTVTQKQFRDVNNLIDSFNRSRNDLSEKAGGDAGPVLSQYPAIPAVTPGELRGTLATGASQGKYTVFVYKQVNGQWVKQEDRTWGTDDATRAERYVEEIKSVPGWTATSNLPNPAQQLAGSVWIVTSSDGQRDRWVFGQSDDLSYQNLSVQRDHGTGTWSVSGNSLTVRTGYASWRGTIQGDRISGMASNQTQTKRWSWSAAHQ